MKIDLVPFRQEKNHNMGLHAVVLNGLHANKVSFVDPALGKVISTSLLDFYKAWDSRGRSGLVIYPKSD